ncbi:MAG: hypothetical protein HY290_11960 [Planctomycetia bacterium]|nr:hypothetical protein [Planctomycetia bacterium]
MSLFELPGARTQATVNGVSTQLTSPWGQSPGELSQALPLITDKLSLTDAPYLDGRININMAPQEVLMGLAGLQGMTPTIIEAIYGAQAHRMGTASGFEVDPERLNIGWLVIDGIVSNLNALKTLDPFVTGRGDVFHLQSVGYFEGGGPMARIEAIIDATQDPPQVIFLRDLTEMGRGFSASLLSQ